jgi:hypothetical protein
MEDRLCLKIARDSLKEIRSSVESGRHTLAGILERLSASRKPDEQPTDASFLESILGRLVVLGRELREQIRELENLSLNISRDDSSDRYSDEQLAKYREINDRLVAIEKRIRQDFKRLLPQCEQMQKDGVIDDFEIESEVSIWLDENDRAYRDDDDNILAVSSFNAKVDADSDFGLDDGQNHNEYRHFDEHPMQTEHHCRLFHELYGHSRLWDDILRADMIRLDTTVRYQNFYYLKKDQQDKRE